MPWFIRKERAKKKSCHYNCKEEPGGSISTITGGLVEINNNFPFTSLPFGIFICNRTIPKVQLVADDNYLDRCCIKFIISSHFSRVCNRKHQINVTKLTLTAPFLSLLPFLPVLPAQLYLFSHLKSQLSPSPEPCLVSYSIPPCKVFQASYINYNSPLLI